MLAFCIPLAVTLAWFIYTDTIKVNNQIMWDIHRNSSLLQGWLGGFQLRTSLGTIFDMFWKRMIRQNAGGLFGVSLLVSGVVYGGFRTGTAILIGLALFITPPLIFINHHSFLDYYNTAAVLYLIWSLAIAIPAALNGLPLKPIAPATAALILMTINLSQFYRIYWPKTKAEITISNEGVLAASDLVRRYLLSNTAILVFGLRSRGSKYPISAWSSEVAYYSERKSLTVSDDLPPYVLEDPRAFLGDKTLGAIVFCGNTNLIYFRQMLRKYAGEYAPIYEVVNCRVWINNAPPSVKSVNGTVLIPVFELK